MNYLQPILFGFFSLLVYVSTPLFLNYMNCPDGSSLCGVLTIESGLGQGNYSSVGVHGLWPEVSPYGNSQCIAPQDTTFDPNNIGSLCPNVNNPNGDFSFAQHEWEKHGQCAGGSGPASVYFSQMCTLVEPIISILNKYSDWDSMVQAIQGSNYNQYLWTIDQTDKQFEFRVCSNGNGNWEFY